MAITVTSPQPATFGFFANCVTADASGCEELKTAPGAGKRICVDTLMVSSGAAISVTIGEGETGGAVTTALVGPIPFAENQTIQWDFRRNGGMILTADTSLAVDASGAGAVCVFVSGRIISGS